MSLLFETILFALTMFRFCEAVRQGWGRGPVLQQFVSDGTWAYALVFATMLVNMMLYKYVRSTLTGICYTCVSPPPVLRSPIPPGADARLGAGGCSSCSPSPYALHSPVLPPQARAVTYSMHPGLPARPEPAPRLRRALRDLAQPPRELDDRAHAPLGGAARVARARSYAPRGRPRHHRAHLRW